MFNSRDKGELFQNVSWYNAWLPAPHNAWTADERPPPPITFDSIFIPFYSLPCHSSVTGAYLRDICRKVGISMWKGSRRQRYALCIHSIYMKCSHCHSRYSVICWQYFRQSRENNLKETHRPLLQRLRRPSRSWIPRNIKCAEVSDPSKMSGGKTYHQGRVIEEGASCFFDCHQGIWPDRLDSSRSNFITMYANVGGATEEGANESPARQIQRVPKKLWFWCNQLELIMVGRMQKKNARATLTFFDLIKHLKTNLSSNHALFFVLHNATGYWLAHAQVKTFFL